MLNLELELTGLWVICSSILFIMLSSKYAFLWPRPAHEKQKVNKVVVSITGEFPTEWKEEEQQLQFYIEFLHKDSS